MKRTLRQPKTALGAPSLFAHFASNRSATFRRDSRDERLNPASRAACTAANTLRGSRTAAAVTAFFGVARALGAAVLVSARRSRMCGLAVGLARGARPSRARALSSRLGVVRLGCVAAWRDFAFSVRVQQRSCRVASTLLSGSGDGRERVKLRQNSVRKSPGARSECRARPCAS